MKKEFKAESKRLMDLMINSIYTHQEIFLREIISNASDAMDKLAYKALTDEGVGVSREDMAITVTRDPEAGILTVSDKGIGMSREELEENLGTICKSGSLGFKEGMDKTEGIDIIGQFGVGFYAAFMVAENVTVVSKKYGEDTAWKWSSTGADGYTISETYRAEVGTDVIMTLKKDTEEEKYSRFLEEYEIRNLVRKYSDYIRYPIRMEVTKHRKAENSEEFEAYTQMETLNSMVPLWQRAKKDVSEEEYQSFYREKFMDYNKPMRTIHFGAEGSVSFKAMMFVPGKAPYDFYSKDFKRGLQLYSSGVLIMDACEDLIPEHFRFVRGVVDSPDLRLNISREMLQHNRQLTVIAKNLEKKVKGELKNMLENDREAYEKFFAEFGRQLKYGAVADYGARREVTQDLLLFYSHKQEKLITLAEYVSAMAEGQEKIYFLPGENLSRMKQLPQVKLLQSKGYDVLLMNDEVDEFIPQTLVSYEEKPFCNVATEDLQTEEEKQAMEAKAEELEGLLEFVKQTLENVEAVRLSGALGQQPAGLAPAYGVSFEMEKYMRRMNPGMELPDKKILELNPEHPAVQAMQTAMVGDTQKAKAYAKLLYWQAHLLADLPVEDPAEFAKLISNLMK